MSDRYLFRRFVVGSLTAAFAAAAVTSALAQSPVSGQDYPNKPIRIVTPFPPGGSTDILARVIGEKLQATWKQPIIVDSRPGGNTLIAASNVARSAPDGYTLFIAIDFTLALTKSLYNKLPFDPDKDFVPISLLTTQPLIVVANSKRLPARNLAEALAYSKANPDKLNFGSGAIVSQLVYEEMRQTNGLTGELINFKGSQPTTTALVAGDVDLAVDAPLTNLPFIKEGRITALAVTSKARMQSLPDVPTVSEAGMPNLEIASFFCLVAPAMTPPEIISKLNRELVRIMAEPDVIAKLGDVALTATSSSPAGLQNVVKSFSDKWTPVVVRAGIKMD